MTALSTRRGFTRASLLAGALLCATASLVVVAPAQAAPLAPERFVVELRVIEATPGAGQKVIDPALRALARDFAPLPFQSFKLRDSHNLQLRAEERASFEFPGKPNKPRFIVVAAHGKQAGGKLRFQLTIDALKFDTLVAVPEGGTIVVAGPKNDGNTLMFALTAKTL